MTMDHAAVAAIMDSPEFTAGEKWVVCYLIGHVGSFYKTLGVAIATADDFNRDRLALGFPIEVQGWHAWSQGDLAKRLRAKGLDL